MVNREVATSTLRLCFVCSGNICRSPMAAGLARHKAGERGIAAVVVSCGTLGINGEPAPVHGRAAMMEIGIDISDHYSQGVQPGIVEVADYIFVMEPRHEAFLAHHVPHVADRIVRTWEWAGRAAVTEIDDPVGQDLEAYRRCRDLLLECLERWFDSIAGANGL